MLWRDRLLYALLQGGRRRLNVSCHQIRFLNHRRTKKLKWCAFCIKPHQTRQDCQKNHRDPANQKSSSQIIDVHVEHMKSSSHCLHILYVKLWTRNTNIYTYKYNNGLGHDGMRISIVHLNSSVPAGWNSLYSFVPEVTVRSRYMFLLE